jgi:predicted DNA-binding protein
MTIMANLVRIVIQLPLELKEQLDALKSQGYTTSGFIRAMLERELKNPALKLVANSRRAPGKSS